MHLRMWVFQLTFLPTIFLVAWHARCATPIYALPPEQSSISHVGRVNGLPAPFEPNIVVPTIVEGIAFNIMDAVITTDATLVEPTTTAATNRAARVRILRARRADIQRNTTPLPVSAPRVRQHRAGTHVHRATRVDIDNFNERAPELEQSTLRLSNIGQRAIVCPHCSSRNYTGEPSGICCMGGKVVLPRTELPPQELYDLYVSNDADARYFQANVISLNNSFAMVSQQMNRPSNLNGYLPAVVIQGEVHRYIGPARGAPGSEPNFLQTYLYDVNYNERLERRMRYLRSNRHQNFPEHPNTAQLNPSDTALQNTVR